jgi:hypothetical protein
MTKRVLSLCLLLLASKALAQERVEVFGYFESQLMGARIENEFYHVQSNKLRVDLKALLSERVTFQANFDYITYHGKTVWNILDFMTPDVASEAVSGLEEVYGIPLNNRQFLDNAFLKLNLNFADLTVGKQQISLGTGYLWNPIDIFNIKDLLDPTYEQPGHNALRLDLPFGGRYTLSALYIPEERWNRSGKLVQLKGYLGHFDYTLIAAQTMWTFHDYTRFDMASLNFEGTAEKRRLIGAATAGELLGVGIWGEYGYNDMENSRDFREWIVGLDYTFDFQTYMMLEYYRNDLGRTDYKKYTLNDWMRVFTQEQKALSRDQIYALIQHPVTDLLDLGVSGIFCFSDGSSALIPTMNYNFSDNVELLAYASINLGRDGAAYSKRTGDGGMIRARVYF